MTSNCLRTQSSLKSSVIDQWVKWKHCEGVSISIRTPLHKATLTIVWNYLHPVASLGSCLAGCKVASSPGDEARCKVTAQVDAKG